MKELLVSQARLSGRCWSAQESSTRAEIREWCTRSHPRSSWLPSRQRQLAI